MYFVGQIPYRVGSISYDITDLVDDAVNILDAYKIKKTNIMGISLGGLIAKIIAIKYPNRINLYFYSLNIHFFI